VKNSYIALMVDDTPALVTGMLGIMKSGNAFVPVNPVFPDERVHFILNDLNIKVILTDKANLSRAQQIAP
jgi:acyl-coenzyme A synthetase/AMP-(fatty) acid ligase